MDTPKLEEEWVNGECVGRERMWEFDVKQEWEEILNVTSVADNAFTSSPWSPVSTRAHLPRE